jgi:amino acid transporter
MRTGAFLQRACGDAEWTAERGARLGHARREAVYTCAVLLLLRPLGMSLLETLIGRRLADEEAGEERLTVREAVPALGLDALASASYGPEAALTVLLPLGLAGVRYALPIAMLIVVLLVIVYFSYRQTIAAYPNGGGSYIVARANLGTAAGLTAAAALVLDYVLNVAVAVSAGIGALVSAIPTLQPHTLALCLFVLALLTLINLRGIRSSGLALAIPTYAYIALLFGIIAFAAMRFFGIAGSPVVHAGAGPRTHGVVQFASVWLLARAFSSGCTAMTGVEAVANGIPAFRDPQQKHATRTLTVLVFTLGILVLGVAWLCHAYGITATEPGQVGYRSVLSRVTEATVGRGIVYHVTMASIVAVLTLSANTSFADFPRLCRLLAADGYLPKPFEHTGRRLEFSYGIIALATLAGILLIGFGGITDRLIPLFAVGAFVAFTLSQAGMVMHWRRLRKRRGAMVVNACGAMATGSALVVILVSKFTHGAWASVLVLLALCVTFSRVAGHYEELDRETEAKAPLDFGPLPVPIAIVPIRRWDSVAKKGLRFAMQISSEVYAVHVVASSAVPEENLSAEWQQLVEEPARDRGEHVPRLSVVRSRYRELIRPLLRFVRHLAEGNPDRFVVVVVPEVVETRWYHYLLHNHTASLLKLFLLFRGPANVVVISTPYYLGGYRPRDAHGTA